jgi:hypothetical protein
MERLPNSLSNALWLAGALWIVGFYRLFGRFARRARDRDIIALAVSGAIGSVARYLVGVGSVKSFHHDMRPRGKRFGLESVAG